MKPIPITHNGKTQSISAWARELGISRQLLHVRLKRGWPLERALKSELEPHARVAQIVTWNSKSMTRSEWAAHLKISYSSFALRLWLYGYTPATFGPKGTRQNTPTATSRIQARRCVSCSLHLLGLNLMLAAYASEALAP